MSVNVICHSDEFLRDSQYQFLMVCFVFLCHFVSAQERKGCGGEGMCVPDTQKRHKSIYYPKVTYVFTGSLSFNVVEPWINESETF